MPMKVRELIALIESDGWPWSGVGAATDNIGIRKSWGP
jgi:hypothetical protein